MGMLDGKVAIVTGGGRGLGRAHCLALAAQGAAVVVNDLGGGLRGEASADSPADEVVREIVAAGGRAVADGSSVSDWKATSELVDRAVEEFGSLDVVVNNAGILRDKMVFSMTEDDYDQVVAVHLKGAFGLTRHAGAYWRERHKAGEQVYGRIINTTSGTGLFGNVGQANYGAVKAGIASLTTISAMELGRFGVTVNAISPIAATRMTEGVVDDAALNDPANAAAVVTYLASPQGGWLTGQVLRINGHHVQRVEGWRVTGDYLSPTETVVSAEELIAAIPLIYGTAPTGRA